MSQHQHNQQNQQYRPDLPPPHQPAQPVKKRHTVRNIVIVVTAVFVVFAGGCAAVLANGISEATRESTANKAEVPADSSTAPTAQASVPSAKPPATVESSAPPAAQPTDEDRVAKVGATQWFEYSDGMKVQVTSLTRFRISQYAAGGKPGDVGVIVTVTLQNGSTSTFDADLVDVKLASGPNGDQAESVFDSDQNLGLGFEGSILPGKKKTARYGFAIPKGHVASTLQLEVAPGWDYSGSHFEGTLSK